VSLSNCPHSNKRKRLVRQCLGWRIHGDRSLLLYPTVRSQSPAPRKHAFLRLIDPYWESAVPKATSVDAKVFVENNKVVLVSPNHMVVFVENGLKLREQRLIDRRVADLFIAAEELMVTEKDGLALPLVRHLFCRPIWLHPDLERLENGERNGVLHREGQCPSKVIANCHFAR